MADGWRQGEWYVIGMTELLFDVTDTAYERYSLIVTANLPFEHGTEELGSERLTGAALVRLTAAAISWRLRARATAARTQRNDGEQLVELFSFVAGHSHVPTGYQPLSRRTSIRR
jgi:hypothetical protein